MIFQYIETVQNVADARIILIITRRDEHGLT